MTGITFFIGLAAVYGLASAQSIIPSSSLCPAPNGHTIYDIDGAGYLVTCSADNDQGSYNNVQATNSYLDCMSACDFDSPCVGFTYAGGNNGKGAGTCWLKSGMTTYPSRSSNIISALRVSNATNQAGVSNSTVVLSSSISSSLSSSTTSVPPPVTSVTSRDLCPSKNFTTYADNEDNNWQVLCGFDTSPSSYDVIDVSSFAACLEACNSDNECVAVSYYGTACYFKNGYEALTPSPNVNSAFIINRANYPVPSRNEISAGRGCGSALPAGSRAGGPTTQFFIDSAGFRRSFSVHVPSSYDTNSAAPLIFAFHGRSETPTNIEGYSDFSSEAINPYGIVVYPLGVAANDYPQWQSDPDAVDRTPYVDDQTFVQDLIIHMTSNYCIDTSRILASGFSNGGGLVGVLACNSSLSNQFSAFAINSGAQYTDDSNTAGCPQSGNVPSTILTNTLVQPVCSPGRRNVPILEFHGDADGTISYDGGPRRGYCLPTIPHWISDWSVRNGFSTANVATPLANGQVTKYEYGTGDDQGIVTNYKIAGWNHAWARRASGAPIDSTPIILDFFYRFTNPNALRYIPAPPSPPAVSSAISSSTLAPSTALPSALANFSSIALPATTAASSWSTNISNISVPLTTAPSFLLPNASVTLNASVVSIGFTTIISTNSISALPGTAVISSTLSTTSTLAPFANTTVNTDRTSVSCPASNGTLYAVDGSTFEIECGDNNTANVELLNPESITVVGATLQECITACAALSPTCQGVNMQGDICYLETTSTTGTSRVEGARLVESAGR
ncbi:hypothetical protein E4T50_08152 [Aureobasidium sp. EXF-12298]|nr:hypothetical protein E4T50_08152 [Aureobasidium sp. EXF-12298]